MELRPTVGEKHCEPWCPCAISGPSIPQLWAQLFFGYEFPSPTLWERINRSTNTGVIMIYGVINKQLRCLGAQLHILFPSPCTAMAWLAHTQHWRQCWAHGGGWSGRLRGFYVKPVGQTLPERHNVTHVALKAAGPQLASSMSGLSLASTWPGRGKSLWEDPVTGSGASRHCLSLLQVDSQDRRGVISNPPPVHALNKERHHIPSSPGGNSFPSININKATPFAPIPDHFLGSFHPRAMPCGPAQHAAILPCPHPVLSPSPV